MGMHAAAVENHELIAIARGQVEIMDSYQRHCPAGDLLAQGIQQMHLVTQIERGGRLIQQHQIRLAGQHLRHGNELALAARELVDVAVREMHDAEFSSASTADSKALAEPRLAEMTTDSKAVREALVKRSCGT